MSLYGTVNNSRDMIFESYMVNLLISEDDELICLMLRSFLFMFCSIIFVNI